MLLMPQLKDRIAHDVIIGSLVSLYLDRGISHADIARCLNEYGFLTITGKLWKACNVSAYINRKNLNT